MIIVDSGFWFGLFDRKDINHLVCKKFLMDCKEPLITTFPVLTESLHLLMRREKIYLAFNLLALLEKLQKQNYFIIFLLQDSHLPRLHKLMLQYADLPMDLADASLVSTDKRDFHTYRWKNQHPFTNLLI